MPSTTSCERGDVVLVRFVFADERGAKRRPVLVLSGDDGHAGREEVIVAALTSNVARLLPGDHLIERSLGRLAARDLRAFQKLLRDTLGP